MGKEKDHISLTQDQGLEKLRKYCAYQDRCHSEVRTKLIQLEIYGDDLEEIMSALIQENFLNEERYAQSYVRGKFRIKKWGKNKILQGLKAKQISKYCIKKGMKEIDDEEYYETLTILLEKKKNLLIKEKDKFVLQKKLQTYAMGRGYEYALVRQVLAEMQILKPQ